MNVRHGDGDDTGRGGIGERISEFNVKVPDGKSGDSSPSASACISDPVNPTVEVRLNTIKLGVESLTDVFESASFGLTATIQGRIA